MTDLATSAPWRNLPINSPEWHREILRRDERLVSIVREGAMLKDAAKAVGLSAPRASHIVRNYGIAFTRGRPRHG